MARAVARTRSACTLNLRARARPGAPARARRAARRRSSENFRPGTLERWNLGHERLSEANPGSSSRASPATGRPGPYAPRAGFASVAEAMGGIRHINGFPGEAPPRIHISLGDSLAGMFAAQGILAALYQRDALGGGRGQVVDVSLMEACFALLESTVPEYDRLGIVRGPGGTGLKGVAPSNIFKSQRRQVDGDRGERRQRLPPALRGDGTARARGRPALRDPPRPRRAPGGDRGHRRRVGGARTTPPRSTASSTRPASSAARSTRSPTSSRTRSSGPARCSSSTSTRSSARTSGRASCRSSPRRRARCAGRRPWEEGSHNEEVYGGLLGLSDDELGELQEEGVV